MAKAKRKTKAGHAGGKAAGKLGGTGRRARTAAPGVGLGPTPERAAKGEFRKEGVTADGKTVALRQVDSLATLLAKGTIDQAQFKAGQTFRGDYEALARASAAPAQDYGRVRVDGGGAYRDPEPWVRGGRAWDALGRVGGMHSPCGAVLVKVVGEGMSLRQFAQSEGLHGQTMHVDRAAGLLIGALGALEVFYAGDRARDAEGRVEARQA
jgi:hypothetical protein